jgi:N,N'-diacetyllegionaminate synthase
MNRTLIIAEAGINHNGDMITAKKLIDSASESGADLVKFQTFKTELGITKNAGKAQYQLNTTDSSESQFNMIKLLELSYSNFIELSTYCEIKKIGFFSTAFDLPSIDFLNNLGLKKFKIPSGEITNLPYLRYIGSFGKPIIMSTGMATLSEIEAALDILVKAGTTREQITVLHCNTEYPTPIDDVNLAAMLTIRDKLGVKVGYSDHTLGIEIPIAAVAMGATIIEKHFTLDRNMSGPDHGASLEPGDLKDMVKAIRNIEKAMGDGVKQPSPSESKNIPIARKSLVAITTIKTGELFTEDNLAVKRPGTGISPMHWDEALTHTAQRDFEPDELIEW